MISLTQIETNFLMFGTSSIFHNDGLSIYQLGGKYLDRHSITFIKEDFEQVKLTKIEDRLIDASDELRSKISRHFGCIIHDEEYTEASRTIAKELYKKYRQII